MRHLLPLCLLLAACGSDTPADDPVAPEVVVETPDPVAPEPTVEVPDVVEDEDDEAPGAGALAVDEALVDGHGGRSDWEDEEGIEFYDLAAIPLADALRERLFSGGGGMLFEDDGSGRSGPLTVSDGADVGTWRLDGGTLTLDTPARGEVRYIISERSERGMVFTGPDGDLRLEDTAG